MKNKKYKCSRKVIRLVIPHGASNPEDGDKNKKSSVHDT